MTTGTRVERVCIVAALPVCRSKPRHYLWVRCRFGGGPRPVCRSKPRHYL